MINPNGPSPFRTAAAAVVLAVQVPLVTFSETTLKGLLAGWLNRCLIVIEREKLGPAKLLIRGYLQGTAPTLLPFNFSSSGPLILSVKLLSSEGGKTSDSSESLGLHPMAGQACPGALCEGAVYTDGGEPKINFSLKDLSESFQYRFQIQFTQPVQLDDLGVFVIYQEGLKGGVCRVESASVFNWSVRASRLGKLVGTAILLLVAGYSVIVLTRWGKGVS